MVEVVLLKGIEPVTGVKASAGSPGYATRLLSQLAPGQLLFARVEAILSDGSFKVVVAGQEMRMALPSYVAAGDMLELTFLTREPRPTFSLQENLPAMTSAPVLSAAGRLVAALMPQAGAPAMIAASPTAAPLLDTLPENGATLSAALEKTLTQSGLFYESHQADWVAGKRDLAQLQSEPQAHFARTAPQPTEANPSPASASSPAATASGPTPDSASLRTEQTLGAQAPPMVQQQLAALESGRMVLQIEVWPHQWMEWEVKEQAQDAAREPDLPANWNTRLSLDLPQLGEINAILSLGREGVQIKLAAANASSAKLLQDHRTSLHDALAEAGVLPAAIAIAQHDQL